MQSFCRLLSLALILTLFLIMLSGCGDSKGGTSYEIYYYTSFLDVPDITEAEIEAIGRLRDEIPYFVYAMPFSTEAFYGNDNEIRGFSALFCEWLSEFFGIPFKPEIQQWSDLTQGLESGEIDFSGTITPTAERRRAGYIMTAPIAERPLKYFRLEDSAPFLEAMESRPLRIAMLEGSALIQQVDEAFAPGSFEVTLISDHIDAHELMRTGAVQGFVHENVTEAVFDIFGDVTADNLYPLIFSQVSLTTLNPEFEPIISVVQKALLNKGHRFIAEMYNAGRKDYLAKKLSTRLTAEELEYISAPRTVLVAAESENYPISFFNTHDGEWQGIAFDVLAELEFLTGLTFKVANDPSTQWAELKRLLESGGASIITELVRTDGREGRFIWPSRPNYSDYFVLISEQGRPYISINEIRYTRVGVLNDTAYSELFEKWFPGHANTVSYDSFNEAVAAMDRGEVDMVMSSLRLLLSLTHYHELVGYKANIVFDYASESFFGFNKGETVLCSIVDKALPMIDLDRISWRWVNQTYDYRLKLEQARLPWLIGATVLLVSLLFVFIIFVRTRKEHRLVEEAQAKAEAASHAKSAFIANMSHEIRTPMNSIIGFSELAMDDDIPNQTREYLGRIIENSNWLLQMINDILDISKIEAGKMELECIPFDLRSVFIHCQTLILPKADEKNLLLHFYSEPNVGKRLLGDPTRLRQVFVNLLSNAVKFTNVGAIKVSAVIIGSDDDNAIIRFEVKDSGIGMTAEQIEKISEPFTQADVSTTRKFGGTGLGLTITKKIITAMGGELIVESITGIGSKFSFELNFKKIDIPEGVGEQRDKDDSITKPHFEGEVLICEDNPMNQLVICEHLAKVGLKAVLAENGQEGVRAVGQRLENGEKPFDLIFMDIHMPVMDGLEAAERISAMNTGAPIAALTANVMDDDSDILKKCGISDYLGKPFTSQELWRCLLKYFEPVVRQGGASSQNMEEDAELQRRLRVSFVRNNQNVYREISDALSRNNTTLAHRLAHTLKGAAGLIGKTKLQYTAAEIEARLKNGTTLGIGEHMKQLKSELCRALEEFKPLLDERDAQPADRLSPEQTLELFDKLRPMLENINPECVDLLDDLRAVEGTQELARLIEDYNFDAAAEALAELVESGKWKVEKGKRCGS